jgi:DNA-binding NarL/FixJ family response regulator
MAIRIVLADDHPIVLGGLAQLFSMNDDIEVVLRCTNGEEALNAVRRARPDVAVLDVKMPGLGGLDVLRRLHEDGYAKRVVLLTAKITDAEVIEAVRLGVGGIVLKEAAPREIVQCVRTVANGQQWLDQATVHAALDGMLRREAGMEKVRRVLTNREVEIVRMAATGMRNKQIAEKLAITEGTVKMHLHSIYEKLGISGRVELSIYARENELV